MRSVNKVIIIGNLTRDPEKRETQSGHPVVTFSVATNREWVTQTGEKNVSTEFHDMVAWARLGELCYEYLKKGKLVYIEGYLKTRSWEAEDGVKRFRTEVVVQDMIMLDRRSYTGDAEMADVANSATAESAEAMQKAAPTAPNVEAASNAEAADENIFEG